MALPATQVSAQPRDKRIQDDAFVESTELLALDEAREPVVIKAEQLIANVELLKVFQRCVSCFADQLIAAYLLCHGPVMQTVLP